jgi:protein TonB
MDLRCLLFTTDRGIAEPICRVLADLGVEGEHCSEAVAAVERVTSQPFQIVIIDWDAQPEAGLLLTTARERKASERPLTLAIVSDDASVPQALQAGANSILRKPIIVNQVSDTLTTARDLLRAKQESAAMAAQAAAAGASAAGASSPAAVAFDSVASSMGLSGNVSRSSGEHGNEKTLHPGEFLQTSGSIPGRQFVTDSEVHNSLEHSAEPVDPLKDLEPMAASVAETSAAEKTAEPSRSDEPRGLQWYLNARGVAKAPAAPVPTAPAPPPPPAKPELLGFDQAPSYLSNHPDIHADSHSDKHSNNYSDNQPASVSEDTAWAPTSSTSAPVTSRPNPEREQKAEAKLFAYIAGEQEAESEEKPRSRFRLGRGPIIAASLLAGCAIAATPQAPWHPQLLALWARGQQSLHVWLNPQPVTTAQAPESHESFGRAGDEYKMPATENIPDATTDPSQIRVVPVVDPTAKKPEAAANPDPAAADAGSTNPAAPVSSGPPATGQAPGDPAQSPPSQVQNPLQQSSLPGNQPAPPAGQAAAGSGSAAPALTPAASQPAAIQPAPASPQARVPSSATNVPSSLKSQIASMRPDAGGDKPPEAAMQSIEPVVIPEAAERALITDQPAIDLPASAKGQQGTVVLQVVVGRDGSVQDAKFMQGSLAFARSAIDGVKLWKFKPYSMNGRAVSVQTLMTMTFKSGS